MTTQNKQLITSATIHFLTLCVQMSYFIRMKIKGYEWDSHNWPKCGKHGVSQNEIEYVLTTTNVRVPDPTSNEARFRTAGKALSGRYVFIVYTYREHETGTYIRPISALYA